MDLSIVIPTFNERHNVPKIVARIEAALAGTPLAYEILFVDDSTDDTPLVLAEVSRDHPQVRYLHRTGCRGLGTAVVEGFHRSSGSQIIVMDADLQHPAELLPVIAQRLASGADIVVPSRFIASGSDGGLSPLRKLVSWGARTIGRIAIRRLRRITDCTGGYFGLQRRTIEGVSLNPIGWKILMEVLVKGKYATVAEIPYTFVSRSADRSKMSLREQWNYLRHIGMLVWTSEEDRRFWIFCAVGMAGMLVNLASLAVLQRWFPLVTPADSAVASTIAMVHNFLWNDRVTWRGHAPATVWRRTLQFPQFAAVSLVGIGITACCVWLFCRAGLNLFLGQTVGIAAATLWNYGVNSRWTWAASRGRDTVSIPEQRGRHCRASLGE